MKVWQDNESPVAQSFQGFLKQAWYVLHENITGRPILTVSPTNDPRVAMVTAHGSRTVIETPVTLTDLGTVGTDEEVQARRDRLPPMDCGTVAKILRVLMPGIN